MSLLQRLIAEPPGQPSVRRLVLVLLALGLAGATSVLVVSLASGPGRTPQPLSLATDSTTPAPPRVPATAALSSSTAAHGAVRTASSSHAHSATPTASASPATAPAAPVAPTGFRAPTLTPHTRIPSASAPSTSAPPAPPPAFPNGSNTGVPARTKLVDVPEQRTSGAGWKWESGGFVKITAKNTTLADLDIHGYVDNSFNGLTVRSSRIRCTGQTQAGACITLGEHSSITDTEIGGGENGATFSKAFAVWSGGSAAGNSIVRVNIHHTVHGLHIDGGTTLADSYIHDLPMGDPGFETDHTDGVFIATGHNVVIKHNTFSSSNNAEIFVQDYDATAEGVGDLVITGNSFTNVQRNGQDASYGVAIENKSINGPITVSNNVFSRGWDVGPIEVPRSATYSGNTFTDGKPATISVV